MGVCTAVGNFLYSTVEVLSGSSWSTESFAEPKSGSQLAFYGVSCVASGPCVLDGEYALPSGYGALVAATPNTAALTESPIPGEGRPYGSTWAVSCASASFCVQVGSWVDKSGDSGLMEETLSGGAWTDSTLPLLPGTNPINLLGVSCAAPGWCVAVGNYVDGSGSFRALAEVLSGGSWSAQTLPQPSGTAAGVTSVSCPTIGSCVAVGHYTDSTGSERLLADTLSSGRWTAATPPVPPGSTVAYLQAVSCPVVGWCTAVGNFSSNGSGGAFEETGFGPSWRVGTLPIPAGMLWPDVDGLSCPGVDACVAVGWNNGTTGGSIVDTLANNVWSTVSVPSSELISPALEAVSCLSTTDCVAVSSSQTLDLDILSGSTWTPQTIPNPPGVLSTVLEGVSCAQTGSCVASGWANPQTAGELPLTAAVSLVPPATNTATSASVTPAHPLAGQNVTYTAKTTPMPDGGNVTFVDQTSDSVLCPPKPVGSGSVTCTTTYSAAGAHQVLAAYSGDTNYAPSSGSTNATIISTACPTGVTHLAAGAPWAVAATVVSIGGRSCAGYWVVTRTGGVTAIGAAKWMGDMSGRNLNAPMIGIAATPDHGGYYLLGADGGIFTFGNAHFWGSTGNVHLNKPVAGMATATGGYWLVAADGGIFTFGNAHFWGSAGNVRLNRPVVGMAPAPRGLGYWLVASDGGIFAFGDAPFMGSLGNTALAAPIVGMTPQPDARGYRLVGSDGGVFDFGDAKYYGSLPAEHVINSDVTTITASVDGNGYYLINDTGHIWAFGDAPNLGNA